MSLLLESCPSFSDRWQEHLTIYTNEELLYVDLGEFAHHLVELLSIHRVEEFPAVFDVIERLHLEGDPYEKEAATIGALEGIQNVAGNTGVDPDEFVQYLRPVSEKWWRQLNDFWNAKIPHVGTTIDEA